MYFIVSHQNNGGRVFSNDYCLFSTVQIPPGPTNVSKLLIND